MSQAPVISCTARREPPPIAAEVLEGLAAHARAGGGCLALLRGDGTLFYHDASAGAFYAEYVVPALRQPELAGGLIREAMGGLTTQSRVQSWDFVPGAALCAVAYVDRRQVQAVLLLAGRRADFAVDANVAGFCRALGVAEETVAAHAKDVLPNTSERLAADTAMLLALLADRLKIGCLEQEISSLSHQLSNTYEELTLIDQVSGGMRVTRPSGDFFQQTCQDVKLVINVRGMGVALSDTMAAPAALYGDIALPEAALQRLGEELLGALKQKRNCLLVNNLAADKTFAWLSGYARQLIAVPLERNEQVLGCLFGLDKLASEFDSVDAKLLTSIATTSAIYLENAMLFGDVHDLMMGMLHSLTSAIDAKDAYTCGHSERVALLSQLLARRAGLSEAEAQRVYMSGLLHDVGKIGVSESVLQKCGRLTAEEFEQMKKHPGIGARILAEVKQLGDVVPGVLHHHERYDGKGYPAGLPGREIPLMGRIICLADCFDAMTSNRTYRKALPLEVALAEIRRCSGTQFDPQLTSLFLEITPDQFRELLRAHETQAKRLVELQRTLRAA